MVSSNCDSTISRVRFQDMTEAERRHYAARRAREEHPDDDRLALLRANVIYANHVEAMSGQAGGNACVNPKASEAATSAWREYVAAKHGDKYDAQTGYRPWLPVVWPQAKTDGSRPDLAGVRRK